MNRESETVEEGQRGEPDAGDDVGGVRTAHDRGRMLVDHAVVDGAGLGVAGIRRQDDGAAQGGLHGHRRRLSGLFAAARHVGRAAALERLIRPRA